MEEEKDDSATAGPGMRCSYEGCTRGFGTTCGPRYHHITPQTKAGSRNWEKLIGMTLCKACYARYSRYGSLQGASEGTPPAVGQGKMIRSKRSSGGALELGGLGGGDAAECEAAAQGGSAGDATAAWLSNLKPSSFLDEDVYVSTDSESPAEVDDGQSAAPTLQRPDVLNASESEFWCFFLLCVRTWTEMLGNVRLRLCCAGLCSTVCLGFCVLHSCL